MSKYKNAKPENKQKQIQEWQERGAEWCAKRLWEARNRISVLERARYERYYSDAEETVDMHTLCNANRRLAQALKAEGVKPQRLIIIFKDGGCIDESNENDCWIMLGKECTGCKYYKEWQSTRTLTFYTWEINEGMLNGITKEFEDLSFEVVSVIDEKTKTVLWQAPKETDEDEQGNNA